MQGALRGLACLACECGLRVYVSATTTKDGHPHKQKPLPNQRHGVAFLDVCSASTDTLCNVCFFVFMAQICTSRHLACGSTDVLYHLAEAHDPMFIFCSDVVFVLQRYFLLFFRVTNGLSLRTTRSDFSFFASTRIQKNGHTSSPFTVHLSFRACCGAADVGFCSLIALAILRSQLFRTPLFLAPLQHVSSSTT